MGFLDKLREFAKPTVPHNLSDFDLLKHFGATMAGLIEARLAGMETWLEDTDRKLTELFDDFAVVAATDTFSIQFNAMVKAQVDVWIAEDDILRARFTSYWDAYSQRLKSTDMLAELKKTFKSLEDDITKHAANANRYSRTWIARSDKAGLVIEDAKTRNTIKWFATVTADILKAEYARERKK